MAVVEVIYEENARDIPAMARKLAANIESGSYGTVDALVSVIELADGSVEVFGWGEGDYHRTLALLALAQHKLLKMRSPTQ